MAKFEVLLLDWRDSGKRRKISCQNIKTRIRSRNQSLHITSFCYIEVTDASKGCCSQLHVPDTTMKNSSIIIQPSTQAAGALQVDALVYHLRWGKYLNSAPGNVQIGLQSSDSSVTSYFRSHP